MAFVINHITIAGGRLVRDAEISYASSTGNARLSFDIAVDYSYRDKKTDQIVNQPSFFKVILWGKQAESVHPFMKKGTPIALEGRLSQRKWQRDDGTTASIIEIVASTIVLMGAKQSGSDNYSPQNQESSWQNNQGAPGPQPAPAQPQSGSQAAAPNSGMNNFGGGQNSGFDDIDYSPISDGEDGEYPPF